MSVNGKRDGFTREDFQSCGRTVSLPQGHADRILASVADAVAEWRRFAAMGGLDDELAERIGRTHRLDLAKPRALPLPGFDRAQGTSEPPLGESGPREVAGRMARAGPRGLAAAGRRASSLHGGPGRGPIESNR